MLLVQALGFVIVLALLGGGLWFLGWSLWEILLARDSERWPVTTGVVIVSRLLAEDDRGPGILFGWRNYLPDVRYRYHVGGQSYDGKRVVFGQRRLGQAAATTLVKRYPANITVAVHYHPARPSLAVLQPEMSWPGLTYQAGLGLALYLIGAFVALVVFHW